jgi:rifampicin phosphotransferase
MRRVFAELGTPADSVQARFVNGYQYTRLRPLISPDRAVQRLPPSPVLRIGARVHPAFRARTKAAKRTLETKPWLGVARRWDAEIRPELIAQNLAFQDVRVTQLDDPSLSAHAQELLTHWRRTAELHFWLHGFDLGPIAHLLHLSQGWGLPAGAVLGLLRGDSPSTIAPVARLVSIRHEVERSGAQLSSTSSLTAIAAASPECGQLVAAHLREYGHRLVTGYDLDAKTLHELPALLVASIRFAVQPSQFGPEDQSILQPQLTSSQFTSSQLTDRLTPTESSDFEEALADARSVVDLRDDNGPLTFQWPAGLMRRALLEIGSRLRHRDQLTTVEDVLCIEPTEAPKILLLADPLRSAVVAQLETRVADRRRWLEAEPPQSLGPVEPTPPASVLPEPLPQVISAVQTAMKHLGSSVGISETEPILTTLTPLNLRQELSGVGVGSATYEGRIRVVSSAAEAVEHLEPGDILVVQATSPSFNSVLLIAGGIITSEGGLLSHAAVLARELNIPAVLGVQGALSLSDGATVVLDPTAGTVTLATG